MKIGILTFQHSINFGAQLQCFALQEALKGMGHKVEVINYIPDNVKVYPFYRGLQLKRYGILVVLKNVVLRFLYAKKMRKRFEIFQQQYINLSESCTFQTINTIAKQYDGIIVGSDQVWGSSFHNQPAYFIGWQPEYKGKRISFAPCCAYNKIKDTNKLIISNLLTKFDLISVRNIETQKFVHALTGIHPPIVLDPTFLHDFSEIKTIFTPKYKRYILSYILGEEIKGGHKQIINQIKKIRGNLPVISIVLTENRPQYFLWSNKTYWTLNPIEWISLIANADFFYTDSFHGVVFALKFNVNFLAYYTEAERSPRFIDLSERFFLKTHIVSSVEDALSRDCINQGTPNFDMTNDFIDKQIDVTNSFLRQLE